MKIRFVIGFWLLSVVGQAQDVPVKGTYTDMENAVHSVTFLITTGGVENDVDWFFLQERIRYNNEKGESEVLLPHHASEVAFAHDEVKFRMSSVKFSYTDATFGMSRNVEAFVKEEIGGPCKAFNIKMQDENSDLTLEHTLLRKKDQYYLFRYRSEKTNGKKAQDFFSDCAEMVQKLNKKELPKEEGEVLARFYNSYCANSEILPSQHGSGK